MLLVLMGILGSSPLARGLRILLGARGGLRGIIPARAGFTSRRRRPASWRPDHPRSRGVYTDSGVMLRRYQGSSPLARGLRRHHDEGRAARGIIPARAGFTATRSTRRPPARDHPRSRGVYDGTLGNPAGAFGSSPLARGLRPGPVVGASRWGIIPARAGFTR